MREENLCLEWSERGIRKVLSAAVQPEDTLDPRFDSNAL
jgi:hypothetical protein